jgi:tape measure domain-containing protein
MAKLGDLIVRVGADTREFNKELGKIQRQIRQTSDNIMDMGKSMTMGVTLPIVGLGGAAVKAAADLETMETQFISLTGGAEQAGAMVDQLNQFAAATPFQIEEIAGAARQLLAAGTDISQVNEQLGFLGDIAATSGESIEDITAIFAKVQAKGKVELENLNQLAERGIPIFTALSEATGLLPSQLGAGAVTVEQFNATLRGFAEEGGFAHGAMERLSQTAAGKFSTALDNLKQAGASLGNVLLPYVTAAIDKVTELAAGFMKLDDRTKKTIVVVAAIAAAIGPVVIAVGALHKGFVAVNLVLPMLKAGIMRLHAALMANPYVAAAAAVGVLVAAIVLYKSEVKQAREEHEEFTKNLAREGVARVTQLGEKMLEMNGTIADAEAELARLKSTSNATNNALSGMTNTNTQAIDAQQKLVDELKAERAELSKLRTAAIAQTNDYNARVAIIKAYDESQRDVTDSTVDNTTATKDNTNAQREAYNEFVKKSKAWQEQYDLEQDLAEQRRQNEKLMMADVLATPEPVQLTSGAQLPELDLFEIPGLEEEVWEAPTQSAEEYFENLARIREEMLLLAETSATWGMQFGEVMGQIVMGTEGASEAFKSFASSAVDAAFNAATALAIQAAGQTAVGAGPAAAVILPALITAGMGLMKSVFSNIMQFADGGIISGPTLGLMGEYSGARTNPEVVAPLDKLRSMIGGAGGNVIVTGRLDGRDILLSSERSTIDRYRTRGY